MGHGLGGCEVLTVVAGLVVGGGGVARSVEDLAVAASVVEPVDVFEGGELDVVEASPLSMTVLTTVIRTASVMP